MDRALYGPGGFFVSGPGPADHFRTSVHASPAFAAALLRLVEQVDAALGHPARLDVVDVGAGRGELLRALSAALGVAGVPARSGRSGLIPPQAGSPATPTPPAAARPPLSSGPSSAGPAPSAPVPLASRVRLTAVEKAARPGGLPERIRWVDEIPSGITGLLVATEWLDNVPLDVAVPTTADGWRHLLVDPATGAETVGEPVDPADADWLARWWPVSAAGTDGTGSTGPGFRADRSAEGSSLTARSRSGRPEPPTAVRAEIGRTRDDAWAEAVRKLDRGLALAVDYGHLRDERPIDGTLTGYRGGRQVPPVPDGSCDVTAHVAVDSVASAGAAVARCAYSLVSQREALRALGADGGRPPLSLAATDPAGYVRALAAASAVGELTDPAGLGGHWWLRQPVGVDPAVFMAR
ncbi:SAM-dependent methyltransferase [Micromonospora phytophila]|uniref:SAM-dependent methyltransferase n=1 Tax=Micromonospora phytophila TaxID=709888 RepID=UPI002030D3B8|nr:SAM-dependent methyltransferase [Micromonospora phytophila]MCM0678769.1 SAM-dependent methyltransferase [Micromonospora phytophila]